MQRDLFRTPARPWNTGHIVGPKAPFKAKHVWAIRQQLKSAGRVRDLALFNCAIDAKLRGCDLVSLRVGDVAPGGVLRQRSTVIQQKTGRPVPFEITEPTREALAAWLQLRGRRPDDWLFPSSCRPGQHVGTRQYARLVRRWAEMIDLNPAPFGTHSLRRTKVAMVYKKTGNIRACQLLLGHRKLESTVRYLGIESGRCPRTVGAHRLMRNSPNAQKRTRPRSAKGGKADTRAVDCRQRFVQTAAMVPLRFIHLNLDWNAEPNAPGERVHTAGQTVRLDFDFNPWAYQALEGERADLLFQGCARWRLGRTNDEGWYGGQCRYSGVAPKWGEFYEIVGDDPVRDLPDDWIEIGPLTSVHRHFLFYLRDQTFECMAVDWRLQRLAA